MSHGHGIDVLMNVGEPSLDASYPRVMAPFGRVIHSGRGAVTYQRRSPSGGGNLVVAQVDMDGLIAERPALFQEVLDELLYPHAGEPLHRALGSTLRARRHRPSVRTALGHEDRDHRIAAGRTGRGRDRPGRDPTLSGRRELYGHRRARRLRFEGRRVAGRARRHAPGAGGAPGRGHTRGARRGQDPGADRYAGVGRGGRRGHRGGGATHGRPDSRHDAPPARRIPLRRRPR